MKTELKRCPFCGDEAERAETTVCIGHGEFLRKKYVYCPNCGAQGPCFDDRLREETEDMNAVSEWNCRF